MPSAHLPNGHIVIGERIGGLFDDVPFCLICERVMQPVGTTHTLTYRCPGAGVGACPMPDTAGECCDWSFTGEYREVEK